MFPAEISWKITKLVGHIKSLPEVVTIESILRNFSFVILQMLILVNYLLQIVRNVDWVN